MILSGNGDFGVHLSQKYLMSHQTYQVPILIEATISGQIGKPDQVIKIEEHLIIIHYLMNGTPLVLMLEQMFLIL